MLKLYSQLIGLPVFDRQSGKKVARVFHLVLDPDSGTLVALITTGGKAIALIDIGPFRPAKRGWQIREQDAIIDQREVVRLNRIEKPRRWIVRKRVVTESGEELGKVADIVLSMETLSLTQIYVIRKSLWWTVDKRIIDWKDIVEITDQCVVVKNQIINNPERLRDYLRIKYNMRAPIPMTTHGSRIMPKLQCPSYIIFCDFQPTESCGIKKEAYLFKPSRTKKAKAWPKS